MGFRPSDGGKILGRDRRGGGGLLVCSYDTLEQTLGAGICVSAEGVELPREGLCVSAMGRRWECDAACGSQGLGFVSRTLTL